MALQGILADEVDIVRAIASMGRTPRNRIEMDGLLYTLRPEKENAISSERGADRTLNEGGTGMTARDYAEMTTREGSDKAHAVRMFDDID